MTKMFFHGRTEAIRSVTPESVEFVQTFWADNTPQKKIDALKTACQKHTAITKSRAKLRVRIDISMPSTVYGSAKSMTREQKLRATLASVPMVTQVPPILAMQVAQGDWTSRPSATLVHAQIPTLAVPRLPNFIKCPRSSAMLGGRRSTTQSSAPPTAAIPPCATLALVLFRGMVLV